MIGKSAEIYLFDNANLPKQKQMLQISNDRTIIIVYAGICDTHEINIQIGGNADARVIIIPLLWYAQSLDLVVNNYHAASSSKSDVKIVGAVADKAQLCTKIVSSCYQNVYDAVTEQKTDILLLSPHAHACTMPAIQAINMNVRCKHGASIKTFDGDQLMYMNSRGLDGANASRILCESFLLAALDDEVSGARRQELATYIRHIVSTHLVGAHAKVGI